MKKTLAVLLMLLSVTVFCLTAYVNYDNISGAFGSGPPHYDRTTNMDKWQNPMPYLVGLNLVALAVILVLSRWALKLWRSRQS